MPFDEVLTDSPAGRAIVEMARRQGGDHEQVRRAIAAVVPELARHLERNTLSRAGLANFVARGGDELLEPRRTQVTLLFAGRVAVTQHQAWAVDEITRGQ